jgi:DNA primase
MPGPADEIKARINIVELVGETVKLRRSGRSYTGLCPFHVHSKNTPSFVVWPESGTWRCFGQCNEGGDIFKFVMKKENWGFREALESLAGRAGVELKPRTPQDDVRDEEYKRLHELLDLAVTYYRNLLLNAPQAQTARAHLEGRSLTPTTLETFGIGYALPAWDAAQRFFAERGFTRKEMVDSGMIIERDDGTTRDRFRNRIMIPIRDGQGRMVGFGARHLDPNDNPKFLNSPLTPLFNKGDLVYGMDRARKTMSATGVAVLVEGYMDVMAAHQGGFTNVVSAMGTALTETQLRLMKKFAKRIVLALDADAAGDKATLRGLNVARDTLEHEYTPTFDARGLIRSESKLQADIRVFTLPDGLDPDELIASTPDAWKVGIDTATPVVEYVMKALTAGRDLDDPKVKSEVAGEILPIIQDVADPVERDTYRQKLARLLKVDVRALTEKMSQSAPRSQPSSRPNPRTTPPVSSTDPFERDAADFEIESTYTATALDRLESYCLGALVTHPNLLAQADRQLRAWNLLPLSTEDFSHTDLQIIFDALKVALDQHHMEPLEFLSLELDENVAPQLHTLLEASHDVSTEDRKRIEDILSAVIRLRKRNIDSALQELRFLQESADSDSDEDQAHIYQEQIYNLVQALHKVTNALKHYLRRAERFGAMGLN